MLDDGDHAASHEAGRSHHLTTAGDLGHLDCSPGDDHVDPATLAGGDHLEAAHLIPRVDEDLHSITLHRFTSVEDCQRAATRPPSAISTCPVTKLAASEAKNNAGPTISSGCAMRRWKLDCAICS